MTSSAKCGSITSYAFAFLMFTESQLGPRDIHFVFVGFTFVVFLCLFLDLFKCFFIHDVLVNEYSYIIL